MPPSCNAVPYHHFESEWGLVIVVGFWAACAWTYVWFVSSLLGYCIVVVCPRTKHNDFLRTGRNVAVLVNAAFVATLAVYTTHSISVEGETPRNVSRAVVAAIHFTAFEVVDLVFGCSLQLLRRDIIIHHMVHIYAAMYMTSHCLPSCVIFLTQHVPTVFQSLHYLFYDRAPRVAKPMLIAFGVSFFAFRLFLGTFVSVAFVWGASASSVSFAVLLGVFMQWYWACCIFADA